MNEQATRAADDSRHVVAAIHSSGVISHVFFRVQLPVHKKCSSQNPRQWNESRVNALEHFEFPAISRATVEYHGDGQRDKEEAAEEHQHKVQIERRINLADVRKRQRPGEKYRRALQQPPTEHDFSGSGSQSAGGALIRCPLGAAIKAACHHIEYKTGSRTSDGE